MPLETFAHATNDNTTSIGITLRMLANFERCGRGVALLLAFAVGLPALAQAPATKPNIVFILVDNVGWGDFGVYGGMTPTPRIDKLASEGIRFNNYNGGRNAHRRDRPS